MRGHYGASCNLTINRFVQNNRAEQVVIIHTQLARADDSALAVLC